MDISNLSDAKFKTLILRMLKELRTQKHKIDPVRNRRYTNCNNNLQGIKGEWMKPKIIPATWNIR